MTPDKYAQLRQLYELERLRRTIPEIAQAMQISEYAVRNLKKDPDYAEVRKELRGELREAALSQVHELGSEAIEVLRNLMYTAKSDFVKFNAAAKLGDWMGLSTMIQPEEADDRGDVSGFLKQFLDKRSVTITSSPLPEPDHPIDSSLHLPIVQQGGLLPDQILDHLSSDE